MTRNRYDDFDDANGMGVQCQGMQHEGPNPQPRPQDAAHQGPL